MKNQVGYSAVIVDGYRATGRRREGFLSFRPPHVAAEPCPPGRRVIQSGSDK
ncbi:MAG: hypothetical protein M0Z50_12555 [Planctomycetia bacterium]|nr:hypothetical protein [Planctomycetia bacterium]